MWDDSTIYRRGTPPYTIDLIMAVYDMIVFVLHLLVVVVVVQCAVGECCYCSLCLGGQFLFIYFIIYLLVFFGGLCTSLCGKGVGAIDLGGLTACLG